MQLNDHGQSFLPFPIQYSTRALSGSTANPGELTGNGLVVMVNTGANPGTYTSRTVAQMLADYPAFAFGQQYYFLLCNFQGTGVLTFAGGANVTASGTLTVAVNTCRLFQVTVVSPTSFTIQGLLLGFTGNV